MIDMKKTIIAIVLMMVAMVAMGETVESTRRMDMMRDPVTMTIFDTMIIVYWDGEVTSNDVVVYVDDTEYEVEAEVFMNQTYIIIDTADAIEWIVVEAEIDGVWSGAAYQF